MLPVVMADGVEASRRQNPSGFETNRSKVYAPRYAYSETPPSRKNAKAIIATLFRFVESVG
jgi:hypothetical protein